MLNSISRTWLLGGWLAAVAVVVAVSVGLDARTSTSAFLLAIGVAPAVVIGFMRAGAPSPSVAEILQSVNSGNNKDAGSTR
jgi:hypothetical protein